MLRSFKQKANQLGPNWPGQRCLAKTRKGTPCQNPAVKDNNRCRMNGGKSTGPRTAEGKARVTAANTKHGRRSAAHLAVKKKIWSELRRVEGELRLMGLIK